MPDTHRTETEPRQQLFEKMDEIHAGMLGIEGSGAHMRPMTHFIEPEKNLLWFLTSRDTDLAQEVGQGGTAHFCLTGDEGRYYACLRGTITQSENAAKVDELWSPVVAAWFKGRDDADLLLLKFSLRDAEVWSATESKVQFGLEIAKANMNREKMPDIGAHESITFGI
ncbi:pyridoxamine 5'-phosphate oxidase family protein [Tateyamaria pelophila]|uniref:pyridoxamine 5'-phosphate oxidase family protein n=1 Tax=Tateyamaria pelophila TaxID=328415 RepID=UPI001CBD19AC|nr:pyridoxamine 5'-phosphate oxidase family protein [Tateyamaria pelophila]